MPFKYFDKTKKKKKWKQMSKTVLLEMLYKHRREQFDEFWDKNCRSKNVQKHAQLRICIFLYDIRERNP